MRASPLHPLFELIVHDIDLREVAGDTLYPDIRQAFETHSALLFPKQSIRIHTMFASPNCLAVGE